MEETLIFINKMYHEQKYMSFIPHMTYGSQILTLGTATIDAQSVLLESDCNARLVRTVSVRNYDHADEVLPETTIDAGSKWAHLRQADPLTVRVVPYVDLLSKKLNESSVTIAKSVYVITVGSASWDATRLGYFEDQQIAERVAKAYIHAMVLCGAKADPF